MAPGFSRKRQNPRHWKKLFYSSIKIVSFSFASARMCHKKEIFDAEATSSHLENNIQRRQQNFSNSNLESILHTNSQDDDNLQLMLL